MDDLRATYRLQLSPDFGFAAARALIPYLRELGVSHLYLSPTLQARSGSTHGYDVVDPTQVSEALGGEDELRALAAEMPVILDIVPNHMGTGDENRWWPDRTVFDFEPDSDFYRRFFDIDDLAAVRQEDPDVFELTHRKTLELIRDGVVDGVRVDHPDGLADPAGYFERLRDAAAPTRPASGSRRSCTRASRCATGRWTARSATSSSTTPRRCSWTRAPRTRSPVPGPSCPGTTGTSPGTPTTRRSSRPRRRSPARSRGWSASPPGASTRPSWPRRSRALPVYRTYLRDGVATDDDRAALAALPDELSAYLLESGGEFVTRFQQTSPPVTAKGIEDTAFYRYLRLHRPQRGRRRPRALRHRRGERSTRPTPSAARAGCSSPPPTTPSAPPTSAPASAPSPSPDLRGDWVALARQWVPEAPDPTAGFLVLQTLIGAHPIEPLERLDGYLEKALREAKLATNWIDPDTEYEASVQRWARGLLEDEAFRLEFDPLVERAGADGRRAALGQLALKLTVPGVPDVYGGDEVEYRALVDPDNRRPVDFGARHRALQQGPPPKLRLIRDTLALRARRPQAFAGAYEPVPAPEGCVAFVRGGEVLVVVPTGDGIVGTVEAPGFDPVPAGRLSVTEVR